MTDINYITNLKILHATGRFCRINDNRIRGLTNLTELSAEDNKHIIDINNLVNLRKLNVSGVCGINDNGIKLLTNLTNLKSAPRG